MIERILVPLDGSQLSESVLPYVSALASGLGSEVVLLQAISESMVDVLGEEPIDPEVFREISESAESAARDYLQQKSEPLKGMGLRVTVAMVRDRPSDAILGYAQEHRPDLIAMSTRGRSGLTRMILGSVAGRVLNGSEIPLLLVHPKEEDETEEPAARLTDILVPLDMSEHGEAVLPLARELARGLDLKLTLAMALPTLSQLYVGTEPVPYPTNALDIVEQSIRDYLGGTAQRIQQEDGLRVEWTVLRGDAGTAIVDYANEEMQDNLIAMSTHGRSGIGRWVLGSVTDKVVRTSGDPVLVVRPST